MLSVIQNSKSLKNLRLSKVWILRAKEVKLLIISWVCLKILLTKMSKLSCETNSLRSVCHRRFGLFLCKAKITASVELTDKNRKNFLWISDIR